MEVLKTGLPSSLHTIRQLPVNVPVAKDITIIKINQLQPQFILCCGMAESRQKLNLESRAVVGNKVLYTNVNLKHLITGLSMTEISEDAGRFVCNGLYYAILNHLQDYHPDKQCVFVHVPILTPENRDGVISNFNVLLKRVLTTH